jgi:hypothetical protein
MSGAASAPDVFISYARGDEATVKRLAAALEKRGWSVFFDRQTPIGSRFDHHLDGKLRAARCVVVLWSETSITSEWVNEEAAHAKQRGVLAAARLHDVDPPFGFALRNYADLFGWTEGRAHAGFDQLVARITELAGAPCVVPEIPPAYRGVAHAHLWQDRPAGAGRREEPRLPAGPRLRPGAHRGARGRE